MLTIDENGNALASPPLDDRYRAAQALDEIEPSDPDWRAIEDVVYARVTPMHILAATIAIWMAVGLSGTALVLLAMRFLP